MHFEVPYLLDWFRRDWEFNFSKIKDIDNNVAVFLISFNIVSPWYF